MRILPSVFLVCALWCSADVSPSALLEKTGIQGGLVVCVGVDSPEHLMGLRPSGRYLVEGIDTVPENVAMTRELLRETGANGEITISVFDGKRLPYTDNLINLLIVRGKCTLAAAEIQRALAPLGVVAIGPGNEQLVGRLKYTKAVVGEYTTLTKPWPDDIKEWTHWLCGPENNAVGGSRLKETPRHLQWIQDPLWIRHHNLNPGLSALVSARSRIFYILDEGPPGVEGPDRWALVARDAFNGIELWKRPIREWGWQYWTEQAFNAAAARFMNPHQLMRRLVAVDDTVYVTPGVYAPVVALDAATGKEIRTYKGTEKAFEIIHVDGALVLAVNRNLDKADAAPDVVVMAVDAATGKVLWESGGYRGTAPKVDTLKRYVDASLAAGGGQVFLADHDAVVGLDIKTGKECWRVPRPARAETIPRKLPFDYYYPDLCATVYSDGILYFSQILPVKQSLTTKNKKEATLWAIDIKTGKKAWMFDCVTFAHFTPPDIFINRGLVWTLEDATQSLVGLDPKTGKKKQGYEIGEMMGWGGGHHNCYRNKATERFIFTAKKKGTDYVDLETGEKHLRNWIKGACRYGLMPANGMLYFPSHNCRCYITTKLNGFCALSGDAPGKLTPSGHGACERGAASDRTLQGAANPSDWPTYRHDSMRTAHTAEALSPKLAEEWSTKLEGKLTQPVIAQGRVFLASVDQHAVHCLDRETGQVKWNYTAGGRVDSPPTWYEGRLIFGARDGYVYCLDAADGALVWRFRAAPMDMRVSAFGQIESAWPVSGSAIVRNDRVYCAAGRSTNLNNGLYLYALDVKSGLPLRSRCLKADLESPGEVGDSVLADILVGNDRQFHIRGIVFDMETLDMVAGGAWANKQRDRLARFPFIKAYGGFLDGTWYNASYLIYDKRPNVGHLLALDESQRRVYGVTGYRKYGAGGSFTEDVIKVGAGGYTLFVNNMANAAATDAASSRRGKRGNKKGGETSAWRQGLTIRPLAMVVTADHICVAGVADKLDEGDYWMHLDGRAGGILSIHSRLNGEAVAQYPLSAAPVHDGMATAYAQLFISCRDGALRCFSTP